MQGRVPQEYLEQFFNKKHDFPKVFEINRRIEEVYVIINERLDKKIDDLFNKRFEDYQNLPWWKKIGVTPPYHPREFDIERLGAMEYFSKQSQAFKEYERKIKNLQVLTDVIKLATISKSQVFCTSYEMRALEHVYKNIDAYIHLQDDIECSLQNYL